MAGCGPVIRRRRGHTLASNALRCAPRRLRLYLIKQTRLTQFLRTLQVAAIPKLRQGSYFPDWLLMHRRWAEQALVSVVGTSYLLGVSTRAATKKGGKVRRLGIPTVADRVVQMALKLMLEPIFEPDQYRSSYAYRPGRRAQDAAAEIVHYINNGYAWVVEGDIEGCFDCETLRRRQAA